MFDAMDNEYKPNSNEKYMGDLQLQYFKAKLLAMQKEYKNFLVHKFSALSSREKEVDLDQGMYVHGFADVDILAEDRHLFMQKEIEDALIRLQVSNYGFCEETGADIGINRLIVNPIARFCIKAQERNDKEKEILYKLQCNL